MERGKAGLGLAWCGEVRCGEAWLGVAWRGRARCSKVKRGFPPPIGLFLKRFEHI